MTTRQKRQSQKLTSLIIEVIIVLIIFIPVSSFLLDRSRWIRETKELPRDVYFIGIDVGTSKFRFIIK